MATFVCTTCGHTADTYARHNMHHCEERSQFDKAVELGDMVNRPLHYTQGKIEPIDVIEDWNLGPHEANVIKYIARAKHKGHEKQDLEKAAWWLARRIAQL